MISEKAVGRLSLYRRLLGGMSDNPCSHIYSHELARIACVSAAQVRRDVMLIGYSGTPTRGYEVRQLFDSISKFLDAASSEGVALVGVGNLGRAILAFFSGRRPKLAITAAFDVDPEKCGRVIQGCLCYPAQEMTDVLREQGIRVGIITVPASRAQEVADELVRGGVKGILNFAPVRLSVPADVFVSDLDMTMSLEKVAFFANRGER